MSFRLVPKSVTLNDLERRNGRYFALFQRTRLPRTAYKFTFAISSADEFLSVILPFQFQLELTEGTLLHFQLQSVHQRHLTNRKTILFVSVRIITYTNKITF